MKAYLCTVILIQFLGLGFHQLQAQNEKDLLGMWTNEDQSEIIEFQKNENGNYEGYLQLDNEKPCLIVKGLTYDGKEFIDGKVYVLKADKWFDCEINIDTKNSILITGKKGFLRKTEKWTRL